MTTFGRRIGNLHVRFMEFSLPSGANICVQKFVCGETPEPLALGIYDFR